MSSSIGAFRSSSPGSRKMSVIAEAPVAEEPAAATDEEPLTRRRTGTSGDAVEAASLAEEPAVDVPPPSLSVWLRTHGGGQYTTALCSAFGSVDELIEYTESAEDLHANFALPQQAAAGLWVEIIAERRRRKEASLAPAMAVQQPKPEPEPEQEPEPEPQREPEPEPKPEPEPEPRPTLQLHLTPVPQPHQPQPHEYGADLLSDSDRAAEILRAAEIEDQLTRGEYTLGGFAPWLPLHLRMISRDLSVH